MAATTTSTKDRILDAAQRRVLEQGFTATTIDAVLADARASKGAFFHHFPSKEALGEALIHRYAEADAATLESAMRHAESVTDDPAQQLIEFVKVFEQPPEDLEDTQPGCLFASFVYEQVPGGRTADDVIRESIKLWRNRILDKLQQASTSGSIAEDVDLQALADQLFVIFEGAFILARATGDPGHIASQVKQYRNYLELLFGPGFDAERS